MRKRVVRTVWVACILALVSAGWAARIEIDTGADPNARLEIRTLTLPDGTETELYVIEAEQIVLTVDGDRLVGSRIEFNVGARVARVVGRGSFQSETETIEGIDLVLALDDETFRGRDVLIVTGDIDVIGDEASRVPGRIRVLDGAFSPCSRCGQEIQDYGFHAERIELYPGDRLVAYEADVLIRGRPIVHLPLLVLPLAPPDRQPRLSITRGTATERAEVAIDWPYVSGASALGTFSIRYLADVEPQSGSVAGLLLGGAVRRDYLGGGVRHRFFTERGEGLLDVAYTPSFVPSGDTPREPSDLRVVFRYATAEELPPPEILVRVERDDARRDRLVEYRVQVAGSASGVRATFESQGYVPLVEDADLPSYLDRSTPLQTVMRLIVQPEDAPLRIGGIRIERLRMDVGAFEDISNATNRSAALSPTIRSGRAVLDHRVDIAQQPWSDLDIRIVNDFVGRYYETGERLVDWQTEVRAAQRLPFGRFEVAYRRDINEGETPFRFDQIPLRNRSDLTGSVQLAPSPWVDLTTSGGYVFTDTRSPDAVGWQEVRSTLRLLGPLAWADLRLENAYDPKTGDPGTLDATLELRSAGTVRASLSVEHVQDLSARPPRGGGAAVDTTESTIEATAQFGVVASLDASVGYRWVPPADDPETFWEPLELGVTAGTLGQDDAIPGLRVSYRRDLNTGDTLDLGFQAAARIGSVTVEASERIDPVAGRVTDSRLAVALPGIASLEGRGIVFLPPSWLGLTEDPDAVQRWSVRFRHAPLTGPEVWSVELTTTLDPTLAEGRFRDSTLQGRFLLDERRIGSSRLGVDLFLDARIEDATSSATYLRRASLDVGADVFGSVGIQGSLAYRGVYDDAAGELRTAQLTLDDLAVTARVTDELYVGASLDDVWEFAADSPQQSPFNLQPTLFFAWDRCCWALFGEWDTATGRIRVALTAPGGETGLQESIETPFVLPGRGTP